MHNVAFAIRNISILDQSYRVKISQTYILKTQFEFTFNGCDSVPFTVQTSAHQNPVRSMPFQGSSNASTHWRKSMPMTFTILHDYYGRLGELTREEIASYGKILTWGHFKDVVRNFICCRSDLHIRHLRDDELLTVTRQIISCRLSEINEDFARDNKSDWALNDLRQEDRNIVTRKIHLGDDIEVPSGKTFTQAIHKMLIKSRLPDECCISIYDFDNRVLDISTPQPIKSSDTLYGWLYFASQMITGPYLHNKPGKTEEMFNNHQITMLSKESASKQIAHIIDDFRARKDPSRMIMIRIDENDMSNLIIHSITPLSARPRYLKSIKGTVISNIRVELNSEMMSTPMALAIRDGSSTRRDLLKLFALLKTDYREYKYIIQASEDSETLSPSVINLYKSDDVNQILSSVYSYDLQPVARMLNVLSQDNNGQERSNTSKFSNEFTVIKTLGTGAHGIVFEVIHNKDGTRYALKRITHEAIAWKELDSTAAATVREIRTMSQLNHPGVVKFASSWFESPTAACSTQNGRVEVKKTKPRDTSDRILMREPRIIQMVYIQMELCNYSLAEWLRRQDSTPRNLSRMISWFKQIVSAVAYIHDRGFIHRDLKPSNILFSAPDRLKICDFGIATKLKQENELEITGTYTDIGSALYMAPEQSSWRYTSKVDVFALGLILAELGTVMTDNERREIFTNYRCGLPNNIRVERADVGEFVAWLTQVDRTKRPTCQEMLQHEFLA
ncbi:hypothetical protein PRIPAC_90095, partial [Pristionchus pacificus]